MGQIKTTMSESFDNLKNALKKLPGFGTKSAETAAMYLALENKTAANELAAALLRAVDTVSPCPE